MGMFEHTDVTVKTKLMLRGTEFFQELECVIRFLGIAEVRPLNGQVPNGVIGRKPLGIRINLHAAHQLHRSGALSPRVTAACSLLSLEIILSQVFVSNGKTVLT